MKTKIIVAILYLAILVSLFLPYQNRSNFVTSEVVSDLAYGYEMMSALFPMIFLMIVVMMVYLLESYVWPMIFTLLNLLTVWLVRFEIHFQGFIDHYYDTKSGAGYYILFICSVLFAIVIGIQLFIQVKRRIDKTFKNQLKSIK